MRFQWKLLWPLKNKLILLCVIASHHFAPQSPSCTPSRIPANGIYGPQSMLGDRQPRVRLPPAQKLPSDDARCPAGRLAVSVVLVVQQSDIIKKSLHYVMNLICNYERNMNKISLQIYCSLTCVVNYIKTNIIPVITGFKTWRSKGINMFLKFQIHIFCFCPFHSKSSRNMEIFFSQN